MLLSKLTLAAVVAVVFACSSSALDTTGRGLLGVDSCGSYGKCQAGYSCGPLTAKQCYTSLKPKEKCTEEDACLEDLEMCGPEAYCKSTEKCVKDAKCFTAYEEYVAAVVKPKKEVKEVECFSCVPLEFEEECMTVDVEKCFRVKEEKCEIVPTEECFDAPEIECKKVQVQECQTVLKDKCEIVKEQVCEDKTEVVCKDVATQICEPAGCLDRKPCTILPIGARLCTTEQVCTPGQAASARCARQRDRCERFLARGASALPRGCDQPIVCETEEVCRDEERCVTLVAPACGAFDFFPEARNDCAAQPLATCQHFVKNVCINGPPRCRTVVNKVCEPVTKRVCQLVDKQVCKKVPEQECKLIWKDDCKTIFKKRCDTIDVKQCWPIWVQKCETREVEKCAPPEGVTCGKDTCAFGQKCGTECSIVEEEEEECKEVTIEACIPN